MGIRHSPLRRGDGKVTPTAHKIDDEAQVRQAATVGYDVENRARPWYRRRGWMVTWALVVAGGAAAIVDYPHQATGAQKAKDAAAFLKSMTSNVLPCDVSLQNAFDVYGSVTGHAGSPLRRSEAARLLQDDLQACSFTNSNLYSMATTSTPRSLDKSGLTNLTTTLTEWADPNADAAILDLFKLLANPANATARSDLHTRLARLSNYRAQVMAMVNTADKNLHAKLPPIPLIGVTQQGKVTNAYVPPPAKAGKLPGA